MRYLGVKAEAVYGTPLAPDRFFQVMSEDIHVEHGIERLKVLSQHSPVDLSVVTEHIEGSSKFKGTYEDIAIIFEHLAGGVTTTGVGPFTHTSPPSTGIPFTRVGKSLAVEVHRDQVNAFRYSGMKVISLGMSFEQSEGPVFDVGWIGKAESQETPDASPSYPATLNPMKALELDLTVNAVSQKLFSAALAVDFPVDLTFLVGSKAQQKENIENGGLAVVCSGEICFDAVGVTEYLAFVAGLSTHDVAIVATNGTESVTINMNKCIYTIHQPVLDERNRVRATFELESKFDTTATDAVQFITVNNESAA